MKKYLFFSAILLTIAFASCSKTFVCECDMGQGFTEVQQYSKEKEAEADCYTREVNLQEDDPSINCRVRQID